MTLGRLDDPLILNTRMWYIADIIRVPLMFALIMLMHFRSIVDIPALGWTTLGVGAFLESSF